MYISYNMTLNFLEIFKIVDNMSVVITFTRMQRVECIAFAVEWQDLSTGSLFVLFMTTSCARL